jgi:hypothetical protein
MATTGRSEFMFGADGERLVKFGMQKIFLLALLAGAGLICGCSKQAKINAEKIDELSQKLVVLQQIQSNQLAGIHSQITAIAPTMDKLSDSYFEKSHEDAIFFHTNTLYLLLLVDRKIEAELQTAATERTVEHELAYNFHTNQMAATYLCATQMMSAIVEQGNLIETNINAQTRQMIAILRDDLLEQIKSSVPDAAETARREQMAADLAQLKNDLALIKARLETTNPPAARP